MRFSQDLRSLDDTIDINITPLVDVVFLLLIFFIVTTTFDNSQGIGVNLPEASVAPSQTVPETYRISLNTHGIISLNDEQLDIESLERELKKIISGDKNNSAQAEPSVALWADKAVRHGQVVQIMDVIRRSGIQSLAVATQPLGANNNAETEQEAQ